MAKKKLNKKIAIIGSLVGALGILLAIVLFLHFSRDPFDFIRDAESALIEAERLESEAVAKGDVSVEEVEEIESLYSEVSSNYGAAYNYAKTDDHKIEILFTLSDFHLTETEYHSADWQKTLACWNSVISIDPRHIKARRKLLDYFYSAGKALAELGRSGNSPIWKTIEENATELLDALEDQGEGTEAYVLLARSIAKLEIADSGQTTDPENYVKDAIADFNKVLEMTPEDVDVYNYLARAELVKGRLESERGLANAITQAKKVETEILEKAVSVAPDNIESHINLLNSGIRNAAEKISLSLDKDSREKAMAGLDKLEDEFIELRKRFPASDKIHAAFARFVTIKDHKKIDDAIAAMSKAMELDNENVRYAIEGANLYYRKSSRTNDAAVMAKAIDIAQAALELPDAQDRPGPRQSTNRSNRYELLTLISTCFIDRSLTYADENSDQTQQWISKAEESIHALEQFFGSEENIVIMKWHGLLALAKGDTENALRQMYKAYEDMKAVGKGDAFLSYSLAQEFKNRNEIGLRLEFLRNALSSGISLQKPMAILEYGEVLTKLGAASAAIKIAEDYETANGENTQTKLLKARGYLRAGQYEDAESILSSLDQNETETLKLKLVLLRGQIIRLTAEQKSESVGNGSPDKVTDSMAYRAEELEKYRNERFDILSKLLESDPEVVSFPIAACVDFIKAGMRDEANSLVDAFAKQNPSDLQAKVFRLLIAKPEFPDISDEAKNEVVMEVISKIPDELERYIETGIQYQIMGDVEKARTELTAAAEMSPDNKRIISSLFDIAIAEEDLSLAGEMAEQARIHDLDDCQGNYFAARLAMSKKDFAEALQRIDTCLEAKPIFPYAYVLKAQIQVGMGNYNEAVESIRTASRMVPQDGNIAKQVVAVIQERNGDLGSKVNTEQFTELEQALQRASALNPQAWELKAMYARYISTRDPDKSLAVQQELAKQFPNVQTLHILGSTALDMGTKETNKARKKVLLDIAGSSLEKALSMASDDPLVRQSYSEYLRVTGQQEKVADIFSKNKDTLWKFYISDGQYEKARIVLESLHTSDPKDTATLRGLMLVAQNTDSREELKKYTGKLLVIDNNIENELLQIQMFLETGLVQDADDKLASFRERHPDEPRALLLDGWSTMQKGQLEQSLKLINLTLESDPDNPIGWRLRGQVNSLSGNLEQAVKDLQKSKSISPNPTIQVELARAYYRAGRTSEAIGELKIALEDDRTPIKTRVMLESLYVDTRRFTDLNQFYIDTLKKYPESAFWYYRAGSLALRQKNFEKAEKLFSSAMKFSVSSTGSGLSALDGYLTSLRLGKKYNELFSFASKYIDSEYAPVAYIQMAMVEIKLKNREKAIAHYYKALEKSGSNDSFILKILNSMFSVIGADEVVNWCDQKLAEDKNSLTANLTLFRVAEAQSQYNKSLGYIDNVIDMVGEENVKVWVDYVAMKARLLLVAYMKTGDKNYLQLSIKQHKNILDKVPNNTSIMNNLAYLLADNNEQIDKALGYSKRAHENEPLDANKMDTYAYVLCKTGEFAKAEETLHMAIQTFERNDNTVDWGVYEHLGMAQEGLGKKIEAKASYERAMRLSADMISEKDKDELVSAIERVSKL